MRYNRRRGPITVRLTPKEANSLVDRLFEHTQSQRLIRSLRQKLELLSMDLDFLNWKNQYRYNEKRGVRQRFLQTLLRISNDES